MEKIDLFIAELDAQRFREMLQAKKKREEKLSDKERLIQSEINTALRLSR